MVNEATPVALEDASGTAKDIVPVEPLKLLTELLVRLTAPKVDTENSLPNDAVPVAPGPDVVVSVSDDAVPVVPGPDGVLPVVRAAGEAGED